MSEVEEKPTPGQQLTKARELFKEVREHEAKGKRLVWQLLSHPDTAPEQLVDAHRLTLNVNGMMTRLVTALRHKWPNSGITYHPWNHPDFDKYNRPSKLKDITMLGGE